MNDNDILATFKKHLCGIKEVDCNITKNQIYNFGETMKGINEFVGAIQTISLNLTKIKDIFEKIQWIDDLLSTESDTLNLQTERNNYLSSIKHLVDNAKFMGIELFDVELSCAINGKQFSLDVSSPLNYLNDDIYEYCITKINELNMLQSQISKSLSEQDDEANNINDYSDVKGDLLNLFK
ncbi:flagellar FLiS export co-chaperone [Helicobacter sp. MIT 99-5507]|uniref:flagellar FLiS export co-chaperone n=1 Tax=Helicobacter sp. MIT 99-5507 TaxID=152489 RepID=UPI0015F1AD4D|nr:flagellar FLiS export co-chaperone [Helicobacter sp. MIT 99-5507]